MEINPEGETEYFSSSYWAKADRHSGWTWIDALQARCHFKEGKLHNDKGPAVIKYDDNDGVYLYWWYLNGIEVSPMDVFDLLSDEEKEKAIWDLDDWK